MVRNMSDVRSNELQSAFWNGPGGDAWIDMADLLDRQLEPLGIDAMAVLDLKPGQSVLDVGCGCGPTTNVLASIVHSADGGRALGLDISAPMIEVARARAVDSANFAVADVQADDLSSMGPFDAVFSRFGVMFFSDPVVAFTNLRNATRNGGQLGFVCWQHPGLNEWASGIGALANEVLGPLPPTDPRAPGPFAFAEGEYINEILLNAGWSEVTIEPRRISIQAFGTADSETAVAAAVRVGGVARRLLGDEVTNEQRLAVVERVRRFLEQRMSEDGWITDAHCWRVSAVA
jgi:SAM-dependent methyltransferase